MAEDLRPVVRKAAEEAGLDPDFVTRLVSEESNWNPAAVSKKGAIGLMQVLPSTAKDYGVTNLRDPKENIKAGIAHLKRLSGKYQSPELLAAAYNAGEGAVEKAGGVPNFKETQAYVEKVAGAPDYLDADGKPVYEKAEKPAEKLPLYLDADGKPVYAEDTKEPATTTQGRKPGEPYIEGGRWHLPETWQVPPATDNPLVQTAAQLGIGAMAVGSAAKAAANTIGAGRLLNVGTAGVRGAATGAMKSIGRGQLQPVGPAIKGAVQGMAKAWRQTAPPAVQPVAPPAVPPQPVPAAGPPAAPPSAPMPTPSMPAQPTPRPPPEAPVVAPTAAQASPPPPVEAPPVAPPDVPPTPTSAPLRRNAQQWRDDMNLVMRFRPGPNASPQAMAEWRKIQLDTAQSAPNVTVLKEWQAAQAAKPIGTPDAPEAPAATFKPPPAAETAPLQATAKSPGSRVWKAMEAADVRLTAGEMPSAIARVAKGETAADVVADVLRQRSGSSIQARSFSPAEEASQVTVWQKQAKKYHLTAEETRQGEPFVRQGANVQDLVEATLRNRQAVAP